MHRHKLEISLSPVDSLDIGSREERLGFGIVKIETDEVLLTEGIDQHINAPREGPLVSGYHLAEWLAWNWWRLRWEWWHRADASDDVVDDWDFAHRLSTIGEGYEWPNIAIASDGFRTAIVSEPSIDPAAFRYFGAPLLTLIPATTMEATVDGFVSHIIARMDGDGLRETNLHRLWDELQIERHEPETASLRRLEARLGCDPNEAGQLGDGWRADAARLGGDALEELAAHAAYLGTPSDMMSASEITGVADSCGFEASSHDAVAPWERSLEWGSVEAWRIGERCAHDLRMKEKLDVGDPVSNERLAELSGVTKDAISHSESIRNISFLLHRNDESNAKVVFGSRVETGRRFALARIIGDRLLAWKDNMFPATRAYTYRQKAQRSFAAEFLSPFEAVNDMLGRDDSDDRQNEIAEHYQVSPIAIKTILVNKGRISRDDASGIVHRSPLADQLEGSPTFTHVFE